MSSYGMAIPQPDDINYHEALAVQRAENARRGLDPSDVLAELQHILLEITDDADSPLWALVAHCTTVGTLTDDVEEVGWLEAWGPSLLDAWEALRALAAQRAAEAAEEPPC